MSEGALTLDAAGTVFFANHRFADMVRSPLQTVIGGSFYRFVDRKDRATAEALLRQGNGSGELRLRTGDTGSIPALLSVGTWQAEGISSLCAVVTDLTELKHREELLAAERLARYTVDQAREPIVVCDPEGKILRASYSAFELCGQNPIYQSFDAMFPFLVGPERDRPPSGTTARKAPEGPFRSLIREGAKNAEIVFSRLDGRTFFLLVSTGPLLNEHNKVLGHILMMTDITMRKQMEAELRRANDELELRVRERTAELERSNADLQQFAYAASHDLQEPLRMVASFVQLLERDYKDKLGSSANEYIRYAVDGAQRMQTLIRGLLQYSRVNTRAAPTQLTDCQEVLQKVLQNLSLKIEETQTRITYDPLPTVRADPTQLLQVFQNLIDNAIKFHKKDQAPYVHVSAVKNNGEWVFSVRDNGIGIEPQYFDRIFAIFQRLNSRRDEYPGTGIGLAVVKRIVEHHGGKVCVDSRLGEGTTFIFTLPTDR
jgi:signal transduction histidine kinase